MSRVDVVIPCYKYAHFLGACVQSALSQENVDVRVLIIDDCSPDNTAQVAEKLAAADQRVEFRRHPSNKGHIATYNEGLLEWASGDYCLLLSADDILASGSLSRAARLMDYNPTIVMTYGREIRTANPELERVIPATGYKTSIMSGHAFIERTCRHAGNFVPTPTALVRTSVQKAVGGYRATLPHAGDMEMWLRLAAHGSIGFIDAVQAIYRLHSGNMSSSFRGSKDLMQRADAFKTLFAEQGTFVTDAKRLQLLSMKSLAKEAFWLGHTFFESGDLNECQRCHKLARMYDGMIVTAPVWWKFQLKWLMGRRLWLRVKRLLGKTPLSGNANLPAAKSAGHCSGIES